MKPLLPLLLLFVAGALWRVAATLDFALVNFAPVTALAFCGGAFLRDRRAWLFAAALLVLPDLWIDRYYAATFAYTWDVTGMALRLAALGLAFGLGLLVARRRNAVTVFGGAIVASLGFYLVTNTAAWIADPRYAATAAGWWQAVTLGHPEFPPSLLFLRNALIGDLVFTAASALCWARWSRALPAAARA